MQTMNPYPAPTPGGHWSPSAVTVSPEQATAIQRELKRLNGLSFSLAIPGFILQVMGQNQAGFLGWLISLAGTTLVIGGLTFYARMRGRSPVFGLLGLLSCLGLLVLYFLPKSCLSCRLEQGYSTRQCTRCNAPLGS